MATHGRGALGRFWLGSVPYELMHSVSQPLLLVRPGDSLAAWENRSIPQHVLLPLDGSSLAEGVIESAVTLGSLMDADYTLLRVIRDVPMGTPELDSISLSSLAAEVLDEVQSVQERVQKEAHDYLDGIAERLRARGLQVKTRVMVADDPGTAILDEAGAPGIDLVALETHGRRGLRNLAMGSVARKVIHGTSKPVLVQSAARACSDTLALANKQQ
jgi:nucleotide-binding universal stress UspA family protein